MVSSFASIAAGAGLHGVVVILALLGVVCSLFLLIQSGKKNNSLRAEPIRTREWYIQRCLTLSQRHDLSEEESNRLLALKRSRIRRWD